MYSFLSLQALVPVSDDYVEPLDQVELGTHHLNVSSSAAHDPGNKVQGVLRKPEHEYNEIPENYNAPYYYSDTLKGQSTEDPNQKKADKDPTYCSPCQTLKTLPATPKYVTSSSASVRSLRPAVSTSNIPHQRISTSSCSQNPVSNPCQCHSNNINNNSVSPMARKRYETAFLPSTSLPSQSPDADTLLLSIESASLGPAHEDMIITSDRNNSRSRPSNSNNYNILRRREPSISFYDGSEDVVSM